MIRETYSPRNENCLFIPRYPGEKDFTRFHPFSDFEVHKNLIAGDIATQSTVDFFVMYDQEPTPEKAFNIYTQRILELLNSDEEQIFNALAWTGHLVFWYRTLTWPIWCTSDFKGTNKDHVSREGFTTCYYFYHAFMARDWYRFWQYHPALAVQDKSDAQYRFLVYCRETSGTRQYRSEAMQQLKGIDQQVKYDWTQHQIISPDYSAKITVEDAVDTGIHLVLETLFESDTLYLTEKVFKPMVMSQPFIIWGPPGTLELLRRYGFQTFDSIWSESYDLETDHNRRLLMLTDLVKQISMMSKDDYKKLYQKCLPIIEHNRRRFYSEAFMDFCWQELQQNFSQALSTRKYLQETKPGGQFFYFVDQHPELQNVTFVTNTLKKRLAHQSVTSREKILDQYPYLRDL